MNREIKFNAWVAPINVMFEEVTLYRSGLIGMDWDEFNDIMSEAGYTIDSGEVFKDEVKLTDFEYMEGDNWIFIDEKYYTLLQYTGLKDKKDELIYEGDILKDIFDSGITQEVVYDIDRFLVKGSGVRLSEYATPSKIEVIGNKFQNPELIPTKEP